MAAVGLGVALRPALVECRAALCCGGARYRPVLGGLTQGLRTPALHPRARLALGTGRLHRWCRARGQARLLGSACLAAAGTSDEGRPPKESPASAPKVKKRRCRLDEAVMELHPEYSRNVIQSFIIQGKVLVGGVKVVKSGAQVKPDARVELIAEVPKYVCRAGLKMEKALEHWGLDVSGKVALDAGLSTGGFTDCLIQNGATRVYGVDVGRGQVAEKLRQDERLVAMEKFNLRHLTASDLPEKIDLVTLDLSFISVLKVIPAVLEVMKPEAEMIVLVKPQFEAGKEKVSSGGVVRDPVVRMEVVNSVVQGIQDFGFSALGLIESPIKGAVSGNTEYLAYFRLAGPAGPAGPASLAQEES